MAERLPAGLDAIAFHPRHVAEHRVPHRRHHREVDGDGEHQPEVLADDQLRSPHGLGDQAVDAAPFHFLRHQPDADEDRDEQPEQRHRGQAQVLDDLDVLAGRELADQKRRADHQQREARRGCRARGRAPTRGTPPTAIRASVRAFMQSAPSRADAVRRPTCCTKTSSSVVCSGIDRHQRRARRGASSATKGSGRASLGSSKVTRPSLDRRRLQPREPPRRASRSPATPGHHDFPARGPRTPAMSVSRPLVASRPPATMATRLQSVSASVRMCELKNTVLPASRSRRIERADVAAAQRVEPRHRLVEEDDLGVVDQRLRDADALHHALRVLPQSACAVRRRGRPGRAAAVARWRRSAEGCRTDPPKYVQQLFRRQVVVEIRVLGQKADAPAHVEAADRPAQDLRSAGGREDQLHQQLERRRLARAVGAEKPEDLAALDRQREPIERPIRAGSPEADRVVLRKLVDVDGGGHTENAREPPQAAPERPSLLVEVSAPSACTPSVLQPSVRRARLQSRHFSASARTQSPRRRTRA